MARRFVCRRCGGCCRWEGCVKVSDEEVDQIAAFLGLELSVFLQQYTALRPDRSGLTLIEQKNGSCIFLEDGTPPRCRINAVKPQQCRDFPEHWNFPGWEKECPGRFEDEMPESF